MTISISSKIDYKNGDYRKCYIYCTSKQPDVDFIDSKRQSHANRKNVNLTPYNYHLESNISKETLSIQVKR